MKSLLRATLEATRGVVEPLIARRSAAARPVAPTPVPQQSYVAVAIRPCPGACQAALALAHQRLLKHEVPEHLPLPGCTNAKCRCRLEEFEDRRAEGERRQRLDEETTGVDDDVNRRLPGDRRIARQRARPTAYFNDHQG